MTLNFITKLDVNREECYFNKTFGGESEFPIPHSGITLTDSLK